MLLHSKLEREAAAVVKLTVSLLRGRFVGGANVHSLSRLFSGTMKELLLTVHLIKSTYLNPLIVG